MTEERIWLKGASNEWERDVFGLPVRPQTETPAQRLIREAETRRVAEMLLGQIFGRLKNCLSVAEAAKLFHPLATTQPKRKRGEHGERNPEINKELLAIYDWSAEHSNDLSALPRSLANDLYKTFDRKFGNSAEAIEKQLRRLLGDRAAEMARQEWTNKKSARLLAAYPRFDRIMSAKARREKSPRT